MYSEEEFEKVVAQKKPARGWEHLDKEYLSTLPNLEGIKLEGHYYGNINLAGVNLCNASFSGDFSDTDFGWSILAGANFSFSNLQSSGFIRANLRDANLLKARAVYAEFASASLAGAQLSFIIATHASK